MIRYMHTPAWKAFPLCVSMHAHLVNWQVMISVSFVSQLKINNMLNQFNAKYGIIGFSCMECLFHWSKITIKWSTVTTSNSSKWNVWKSITFIQCTLLYTVGKLTLTTLQNSVKRRVLQSKLIWRLYFIAECCFDYDIAKEFEILSQMESPDKHRLS